MTDTTDFADNEVLIAAWYGEESVDALARKFGVHRNSLLNKWKQLRAQGLLPKAPRRLDGWELIDTRYDGRPDVGDDKLLQRLRKAHAKRICAE